MLAVSTFVLAGCNSSVETRFSATCAGNGPDGPVEHTFIIDGVKGVIFEYKNGWLYGPRSGHKVSISNGQVKDDNGLVIDLVAGIGEQTWTRPGLSDFTPPNHTYSRCVDGTAPQIKGHSGAAGMMPWKD
jgi:hypothetical protein